MNNIQKAFKAKSGLSLATGSLASVNMADGGIIGKVTSMFGKPAAPAGPSAYDLQKQEQARQMAAANSVVSASQAANQGSAVQAAPVQAAPVQAAPQGLRGYASGNGLDARMQAAGMAEGGIVRGKGGPTDDEVPMTVGGVDVNLSNKEAVLPVKTVQALGGPEEVEELIERTNGKPPVRLREGGEYGSAGSTGGGWSLGSGKKPTIYNNGGLPAPVVQAGIDTMKGQLAEPNQAVRTQIPAETQQKNIETLRAQSTVPDPNRPTDPDTDGRRVYSTPTAPSFVHPASRAAPPVQPTLSGAQSRTDAEENRQDELAAQSLGATGKLDPVTAAMNGRVRNDAGLKDNQALPQGLRAGNTEGVPTATWNSKNDATADSIDRQKGQYAMNGGRSYSVAQPDGSFKNVSIGDAQYTGADGKQTSDWSKTQQYADGVAQAKKEKASLRQLQYENNKFNATSDQITDPHAQAAGLRGLAQYDKEAALAVTAADKAADAAYKAGDLKIKGLAAQNTANAQEIAMKKDARDFKASQSAHIAKRTKEMIDTVVPTTGLKEDDLKKAGQKRADFEQAFYSAFKRQPADDNEFNKEAPRMKDQALLSLAMRDAIQNAGFFNKLGNVGHDMWSSLHAQRPKKVGDNLVFEGGFTIPYKDVIGKNADLDAAYKARMNAKEEQ